jgi:hypothetical protein
MFVLKHDFGSMDAQLGPTSCSSNISLRRPSFCEMSLFFLLIVVVVVACASFSHADYVNSTEALGLCSYQATCRYCISLLI